MGKEYWKSACPHDCPSACSLEVERLSSTRIGRIRGAAANSYTDGVVCAKVARYAERVHHPDRLKQPLQRIGAKGSGQFRPISWDAALDEVAEAFQRAVHRYGRETVWPYHSGGTMGAQAKIRPIWETFDGWSESTQGARSFGELPATCIKYVRRVEELVGCPVALLSTSPEREDTILMTDPFRD